MGDVTIGLLHPGEMGAAVGQCLAGAGHQVLWVPEGRSAATAERADGGRAGRMRRWRRWSGRSDLIVSVCPPARGAGCGPPGEPGSAAIYLDANAISPATAGEVAGIAAVGGASYVDGGIIGTPPVAPGFIRLYLSGPRAGEVRACSTAPR